jgi:hypothetical protein
MILSLEIKPSLDIYSFFEVNHSISCPSELWFECVCSSLKRKHAVLILENPVSIPVIDSTRRWQTGDNWSWLAPRSLSVVLEAYGDKFLNYQDFKNFLTLSK